MDLPEEAEGKGKGVQAAETILERSDVVADLVEIRGVRSTRHAGTGREQLPEGGSRPFDAAREHCFPVQEGTDEEVRIREAPPFTRETADGLVRAGERTDEFRVPGNRRG